MQQSAPKEHTSLEAEHRGSYVDVEFCRVEGRVEVQNRPSNLVETTASKHQLLRVSAIDLDVRSVYTGVSQHSSDHALKQHVAVFVDTRDFEGEWAGDLFEVQKERTNDVTAWPTSGHGPYTMNGACPTLGYGIPHSSGIQRQISSLNCAARDVNLTPHAARWNLPDFPAVEDAQPISAAAELMPTRIYRTAKGFAQKCIP